MSEAADLRTSRCASSAPGPEAVPQLEHASGHHRAHAGEPSLGELKARHREEHLCLKCNHHLVCGMAKALDPNLLVTIASCLGFEPDQLDDLSGCPS